MYPVETKLNKFKHLMKCIKSFCTLSTLLAIVVMTITWKHLSYLPINLCTPFVDSSHSVILIKIIIWCIVVLQVVFLMSINAMHILLISTIKRNQMKIKTRRSRTKSNVSLMMQLFILSSSNILCWNPSCVIYIVIMFVDRYPIEIVTWTTILIVPINAIINSVCFCLSQYLENCQ